MVERAQLLNRLVEFSWPNYAGFVFDSCIIKCDILSWEISKANQQRRWSDERRIVTQGLEYRSLLRNQIAMSPKFNRQKLQNSSREQILFLSEKIFSPGKPWLSFENKCGFNDWNEKKRFWRINK